ncbi:hypothetical protein HispidOSU_003023, partial [Sigmodon hispidus]
TEVNTLPSLVCSHICRVISSSVLTGTVALKSVLTGVGAQFPDMNVNADVMEKIACPFLDASIYLLSTHQALYGHSAK